MITKDDNISVYTDGDSRVIVNQECIRVKLDIPQSLPREFFYLHWWNDTDPKVYAYYTTDDFITQTKHQLEPTEENFNTYVKPFVDQWQREKDRLDSLEKLEQAKAERAEAVSKIIVEVNGMKFDGDEESQTRIGRTIAAAIALGVDIDTYTQTWVLADNTIANPTIKQLAEALKLAGEQQTKLWTVPYEQ